MNFDLKFNKVQTSEYISEVCFSRTSENSSDGKRCDRISEIIYWRNYFDKNIEINKYDNNYLLEIFRFDEFNYQTYNLKPVFFDCQTKYYKINKIKHHLINFNPIYISIPKIKKLNQNNNLYGDLFDFGRMNFNQYLYEQTNYNQNLVNLWNNYHDEFIPTSNVFINRIIDLKNKYIKSISVVSDADILDFLTRTFSDDVKLGDYNYRDIFGVIERRNIFNNKEKDYCLKHDLSLAILYNRIIINYSYSDKIKHNNHSYILSKIFKNMYDENTIKNNYYLNLYYRTLISYSLSDSEE